MKVVKIFDKFSLYWRSILVIIIISIVFSLQACTVNKHGAATPERVVEQYLLALENRDNKLMQQLAIENTKIAGVVESKILKIGGHKIQERQITYIKSKPTLWNVKIHGSFIDNAGIYRNFDESILIEYQSKGQVKLYGGRWYLLL
jgi:hypothetical protein